MRNKIIFICTGNSCRSQIAEGLLREEAGYKFEVFSAGSHPSRLHPAAIKVMAEWDIDIQKQKSEKIDEYLDKGVNIVITVSDHEKDLEPYRKARNQIKARIKDLLQKDEIKNL